MKITIESTDRLIDINTGRRDPGDPCPTHGCEGKVETVFNGWGKPRSAGCPVCNWREKTDV